MKTYNLLNDDVMEFDANTTPEWACAYGYCSENNLMSELFKSAQDKAFLEFLSQLPVIYGKNSVCVGDWASLC